METTGRKLIKGRAPHSGKAVSRILLHSEYGNESLDVKPEELLFIQAADNYIDVFFRDKAMVRHRMLRSSMSSAEKVTQDFGIVRCHRSYLVNLNLASTCRRNRRELKIEMAGQLYILPISRTHYHKISQLMNAIH